MKTDTATDAPIPTEDLVRERFVRVDQRMAGVEKDSRANLWPGEPVTTGPLFAIKGVGAPAFDRTSASSVEAWLRRDWLGLFPAAPERTRLFRLLASRRAWADRPRAESKGWPTRRCSASSTGSGSG